jgi:hypothetical protein
MTRESILFVCSYFRVFVAFFRLSRGAALLPAPACFICRHRRLLGAAFEARRQQIDLERRATADDIQSLLIRPGEREVLRRA